MAPLGPARTQTLTRAHACLPQSLELTAFDEFSLAGLAPLPPGLRSLVLHEPPGARATFGYAAADLPVSLSQLTRLVSRPSCPAHQPIHLNRILGWQRGPGFSEARDSGDQGFVRRVRGGRGRRGFG